MVKQPPLTTMGESDLLNPAIIEYLPIAVYTCDADGYITSYNPAAAQLWGRHPELLKERWSGAWKCYYPDGSVMSADEYPMAIALKEQRIISNLKLIIELPDGTRKNILPNPKPIFDNSGKLVGGVCTVLDFTENKTVIEEKGRLAAIVQSSEDAIMSKTLDGIITSFNPSAERLFGYKESEMIGKSVTILLPPDRLDEEPLILERIKRGERVEHFETKRVAKDGTLLDISLTISPIRDDLGNITGASKIARNITAQKRLRQQLDANEERLRLAAGSINMGTWEFDPKINKLIWSDECKKIYGLPEDSIPEYDFVASRNHPDDTEYVRSEVTKALSPDNKNLFEIVYRIFRVDNNQLRWIKTQGRVHFENGVPVRFIGTMLDVTNEKLAAQKIAESEERFRMAIQSTQLGTWEYLPMAGTLNWSDECRRIFDVPLDLEVNYQFFLDHIHPDDYDYAQNHIAKAMHPDGIDNYDVVFRILRYSDKQVRWIRAHGKAYFDHNRQLERFIGTILDITKQKKEEQSLKDSVELFQTMADNVPAMIWMSGTDKFNDYFNKTWLEFRGRSIEQESMEGWIEGVHPDDRQNCVSVYQAAFRNKKPFYTEYRLLRHDRKYRWISDNSVPRYSTNGEFAGYISACIDIDDQKRFREKILDSELLLKTISNAAPVGLWMTNTEAQNTFVNDTWIEWTGIPLEKQLVNGWLDALVPEDRDTTIQRFGEAMAAEEKFNTEFRIVNNNGITRWCLTEGYPFYDFNGNFAGYAGSVTDITDMKKLEQRKDDFIKMASHELKTPITSIKGYVQLLQNIYDEPNEEKVHAAKGTVKSALNTISKQVSKLTRLVSELLDLTRIESGKLELHPTHFDLAQLVEETVQDVRQTTSRHAILINIEFMGAIYADRDRLAQVILNLLTNAIKYSPNTSQVEVFVQGDKNFVTVGVKDYGIGVERSEQSRIFERFYRVEGKSEQTYPGFGIGLFIANEIIQRHHGTMSVQSEKGKGSIFTFTLPLDQKRNIINE